MMTGLPLSTEPLALLVKAYKEVAQKEEVEWVLLSSIGTVLKQFNALFSSVVYGHKDLLTFVKAYRSLSPFGKLLKDSSFISYPGHLVGTSRYPRTTCLSGAVAPSGFPVHPSLPWSA